MPRHMGAAMETAPLPQIPEVSGVQARQEPSFDTLPDTEIVRNYWPSYIGKGGENLVYEVLVHPDVVIKVDQKVLAETIDHALMMGQDPGAESLKTDEIELNKLKKSRESYREVKRVFGQEHVLPQKQYLMRVPVNRAILDTIEKFSRNKHETRTADEMNIDNAWSIVSIQKRTDAIKDPYRLSPAAGYVEVRIMKELKIPFKYQQYAKLTNSLSSGRTAERINPIQIEMFYPGTQFAKLLKKSDSLVLLRDALEDFQRKAVQFANETGQIIDVAGRDNIVFNADADGIWNYTLVDPIYGFDYDVIKNAREGFRRKAAGQEYSSKLSNAMMQVVNFARVINGLGVALGTGEYFDVLPPDMQDIDIAKSLVK